MKFITSLILLGLLIQGVSGLEVSLSSNGIGSSSTFNLATTDTLNQNMAISPIGKTLKDSGSFSGIGKNMPPLKKEAYDSTNANHAIVYAWVKGNHFTHYAGSWSTEVATGQYVKASLQITATKANEIYASGFSSNHWEDLTQASVYANGVGNGNKYANLKSYRVDATASASSTSVSQQTPSADGSRLIFDTWSSYLNNVAGAEGRARECTDITKGEVVAFSETGKTNTYYDKYFGIPVRSDLARVDINGNSINALAGKIDQRIYAGNSREYVEIDTHVEKGRLYSLPYDNKNWPAYASINDLSGGGPAVDLSAQMKGTYTKNMVSAYPGFGKVQKINFVGRPNANIKFGSFASIASTLNPVQMKLKMLK